MMAPSVERPEAIRSHEFSGVLKRWDHTLHVEPLDSMTCRYSDNIVIGAGHQTAASALIASASVVGTDSSATSSSSGALVTLRAQPAPQR